MYHNIDTLNDTSNDTLKIEVKFMSKRLVDYEQVAKACDSLVKDGQRPSMRNVRKIIGHGNMNTILSYLREWKEKNDFIPRLPKNQAKEESSGNNHFRKPTMGGVAHSLHRRYLLTISV
ncbi:MAG: DNA-binding protein [Oligoflexia bacterium]|nr:DNA-binding protein [Oligoflexia bacterium]